MHFHERSRAVFAGALRRAEEELGGNIKPIGNGEAVLKYLTPYVNRVAISYRPVAGLIVSGLDLWVRERGTHQRGQRIKGVRPL